MVSVTNHDAQVEKRDKECERFALVFFKPLDLRLVKPDLWTRYIQRVNTRRRANYPSPAEGMT